ncbi:MAG: PAS domain S-box protein [Bryobacterales bacterium]|nr:PAS domain S-box protein [Bryobacterales bacterium]
MMVEKPLRLRPARLGSRIFRALTETIPSAIFVYQDGRLQYVNPAAESITGYSREELLEMENPAGLIPPDHRQALARRIAALQPGGTERFEVPILARGGERWLEVVTSATSFAGRPAVLGAAIDITGRKLLESQLRQAQKMEALGRLAGGVAHDFNNILTVIAGYGQMLLSRLESDNPARADIEEVLKGAARAASLTGQLLAFSRRQPAQPRVLDLNALVSNMHRMLRRVISEDVRLETVLLPDIGRIKADPSQIEQVVLNLAVNARDAMPDGGCLTIETSGYQVREPSPHSPWNLAPGSYVLLTVTDTGRGMDAETQSHLFEPFFTTKEVGRGTGLGLSTVYGIVKQNGGDIQVTSAPGKGCRFQVLLPAVKAAADTEPASEQPRLWPVGDETILLAEDDRVLRAMLRGALEKQNYTVLEAASGDEALELARRHRGTVHLLITDLVMPGITGIELARRLSASRKSLKVLYITGYAEDAILLRGEQAPDNHLLHKPFTLPDFIRRVRDLLDTPAAGRVRTASAR